MATDGDGRTPGSVRPSLDGLTTGTAVVPALVAAQLAVLLWTVVGAAKGSLHPALPGDVLARFLPIADFDAPWSPSQAVEFPPLSLLVIRPLRGITNLEAAVLVHLVVQACLHVATAIVLWRGWGARVLSRHLAFTLPILPLLLMRLDLLSVLLVAVGLLAVARDRDELGGVLLGAGVLAKIWPGVLLVLHARRRPNVAVAGVATVAVGGLAWVAMVGWDAVGQVLGFRGATGWHMESVAGVLYRALVGGEPAIESGAWRLGTADRRVILVLALIGIVGLAWRLWRAGSEREDQVFGVALLLVVAPLLSPQYMAWLAVPLALAPGRWLRDGFALVASVASMWVIFEIGPIIEGAPMGWFIVVSRNLALVLLAVVAARSVATTTDSLAHHEHPA